MTHPTDNFTQHEKFEYAKWHDQRAEEWLKREKEAQSIEHMDSCREHVKHHRSEARRLRDEANKMHFTQ